MPLSQDLRHLLCQGTDLLRFENFSNFFPRYSVDLVVLLLEAFGKIFKIAFGFLLRYPYNFTLIPSFLLIESAWRFWLVFC